MAQSLTLNAKVRTESGKQVQKIRKSGFIPAVLYGHNVKNLNLSVNQKEFEKIYGQSGENTLISLAVEGEKPHTVLVHDVQQHFLRSGFSHVDFYEVSMTEKIKSKVPVVIVGEAKAIKDLGGVLVKTLSELEVEALPADLPKEFTVDISKLNTFEDTFKISDLAFDADKVKIMTSADEILAKVTPPRSDEELKAL